MLAAASTELRFLVPAWGDVLVALVGLAYMVLGGRWSRLFDVLTMTVLGCAAGLVASVWVPVHVAVLISTGGILVGGLAAIFRNIAHAVITGLVLAVALSVMAGLAVGKTGFASYLVADISLKNSALCVPGPNLASDPVLAVALIGLLAGVMLAVVRFELSDRVATSAQGAALLLLGAVLLANQVRGEDSASIADRYPLTMAAAWVCLVAIGLAAQAAVHERALRREAAAEMPFDEEQPEG